MSQYGISHTVLGLFDRSGFYIEAGASNPFDQNNTSLLEENGWTGLLVEPRTDHNHEYATLRPRSIVENYALVDKNCTTTSIPFGTNGHMSGPCPSHLASNTLIEVPCCTLDNLLRKHNRREVDFFSLDVEGYEHQVLGGIDFDYCKFNILLVEGHGDASYEFCNKKEDFSYLESYGYRLDHLPAPGQYFYIHSSFTRKNG
jgi:FkbM family methyltransferase